MISICPDLYFPGIDEHYDGDYESFMDYEYQTTLMEYSDGNNGANDHDDWEDVLTKMDDEI